MKCEWWCGMGQLLYSAIAMTMAVADQYPIIFLHKEHPIPTPNGARRAKSLNFSSQCKTKMPPSRSRKRDSTLQTVDILNNVGARSRVLHPPRRKLHPEAQVPRSDDIWDILESPKKVDYGARSRVGGSESITPRRSSRIRGPGQSVGDNALSRSERSLRFTRGVNYHQESGEEEEDDDEQELRLFSDEPETTNQTDHHTLREQSDEQESPSFLSPNALLNGQVPTSDTHEADDSNETDETYANNTGQDEEDNDSEVKRSNAGPSEPKDANRPNESKTWCRPPTPVVEIVMPKWRTPHKPQGPPEQEMRENQTERESDDSESEEEQSADDVVDEGGRSSIPHRLRSLPAEQEMREGSERKSDKSESQDKQLVDGVVDEG